MARNPASYVSCLTLVTRRMCESKFPQKSWPNKQSDSKEICWANSVTTYCHIASKVLAPKHGICGGNFSDPLGTKEWVEASGIPYIIGVF